MVKINENDRILSYLGFAKKAGKLVSGQGNCENALKSNKAMLFLLSNDTSANTQKHFSDMATYRNVPIYLFSGNKLGSAIGKEEHKTVVVTDKGFCEAIIKEINLIIGG